MARFDFIIPRFAELRDWLAANGLFPQAGLELPFEVRPLDDEYLHVNFIWGILGTDPDQVALGVAHKCLEIMAHGHRTYIRHAPSTHTYTEDEVTLTMSRVRFFVSPEEGDWIYMRFKPSLE